MLSERELKEIVEEQVNSVVVCSNEKSKKFETVKSTEFISRTLINPRVCKTDDDSIENFLYFSYNDRRYRSAQTLVNAIERDYSTS